MIAIKVKAVTYQTALWFDAEFHDLSQRYLNVSDIQQHIEARVRLERPDLAHHAEFEKLALHYSRIGDEIASKTKEN